MQFCKTIWKPNVIIVSKIPKKKTLSRHTSTTKAHNHYQYQHWWGTSVSEMPKHSIAMMKSFIFKYTISHGIDLLCDRGDMGLPHSRFILAGRNEMPLARSRLLNSLLVRDCGQLSGALGPACMRSANIAELMVLSPRRHPHTKDMARSMLGGRHWTWTWTLDMTLSNYSGTIGRPGDVSLWSPGMVVQYWIAEGLISAHLCWWF